MGSYPFQFQNFPAGNFPAADWDANWATVGNCANIFCVVSGSGNAVVLTPASNQPVPSAVILQAGMQFWFVALTGNTGSTTLNVGGSGPFAAYNAGGVALQGGELVTGTLYAAWFDPTLNSNVGGYRIFNAPGPSLSLADIEIIADGSGAVLTTGVKGALTVPFNCTIFQWTLLGDQPGSIVFDVWRSSFPGYPPNAGNSITGSATPTFAAAQKAQSTTLTGWSTALLKGDTLVFNINSILTCTRVTLSLQVTKN